jgi:hypothetical protein
MKKKILPYIAALGMVISLPQVALAEDKDLAKQLANPLADLISVKIEADYDNNINANDKGSLWITTVEPVIPFSISENWILLSRTAVPIITQDDISSIGADKSGTGDILQRFIFTPKKTSNGLIWGVGPVLLLNTASNDALGFNKWGAGPTAGALVQKGPWTIKLLANHIWSFAGNNSSSGVSVTYMEPSIAYVTQSETTFTINTESIYGWKDESWFVPINFNVEQLLKIGNYRLQVGGGASILGGLT